MWTTLFFDQYLGTYEMSGGARQKITILGMAGQMVAKFSGGTEKAAGISNANAFQFKTC